ncbi:MAG: response regulator [Anaerolineae bacterium]|nr:response regulator [Anaerolineae bacterium]
MSEHLILVTRPSAEALEPLGARLQAQGYTVNIAPDASQTLKLIRARPPKAVLVDVASPEVNGIQVCKDVRQAVNEMTLIALNQGEPGLRLAALRAGADLVLDEPINWSDLCEWLHTPRGSNGHLLAEGPLMGQTADDAIGAASLLSHDLKSPISVIISSLEVMLAFQEEDGMQETNQRLLQGALSAAYRQLNLISAVVDLPRLELGCYELQLEPLDLVQVVRGGLSSDAYSLESKGLNIHVDLPDEPLPVEGDTELLQRVIACLIDNALKFTVRADTLCVSVRREGNQVLVRFTDTGRPIQPGFEQDMMTRAPQWERRQNGARTSVALGLPYIHAVAVAHGGSFTAGSSPDGRKTTFTLSLPGL